VASDGGIFAYGDATFYGSTDSSKHNQPIAGITTTPLGKGYWMVTLAGEIFAFVTPVFLGSTGNVPQSPDRGAGPPVVSPTGVEDPSTTAEGAAGDRR